MTRLILAIVITLFISASGAQADNRPPVIEGPEEVNVNLGDQLDAVFIVSDPDGSPDLKGNLVSVTTKLPAGATFDNMSGLLSWRPSASGSFPAEISANDGTVTVTRHFNLNVIAR
ncbi:MAG: Ig domain-containing protein [Patescibacteria group bacterium]